MAIDVVARALAMQAQSKSTNYDNLSNLPINNQDLLALGFTPVDNTYYRHTGSTGPITLSGNITMTLVSGTIYRYINNKYVTIGVETEPVYQVGCYNGAIREEDWTRSGEYLYYTVSFSTHQLNDPSVDSVLVPTEDGYVNASYSYTRLLNNDIKFKTNIATACVYKIVGNR